MDAILASCFFIAELWTLTFTEAIGAWSSDNLSNLDELQMHFWITLGSLAAAVKVSQSLKTLKRHCSLSQMPSYIDSNVLQKNVSLGHDPLHFVII